MAGNEGILLTEEIEWLIKRNKEWKKVKGIGASILTAEENGKKQEQKGTGRICKSDKRTLGNRKRILDVTFREDANKTLNKNATRNLNILRKLAISILEELPFRKKFSRRIRRYIISKKIFKIIF